MTEQEKYIEELLKDKILGNYPILYNREQVVSIVTQALTDKGVACAEMYLNVSESFAGNYEKILHALPQLKEKI